MCRPDPNPSRASIAEVIHPDQHSAILVWIGLSLEPRQAHLEPSRTGRRLGIGGKLSGSGKSGPGSRCRDDQGGDLHRAKGLGARGWRTHGGRSSGECQKQCGRQAT